MNHVARVCVLHDAAVHNLLNLQRPGIMDGILGHQARPERRKGVETFPPAPLAPSHFQLPVAGADVVSTRVPGHIIERPFAWYILARLSDYDHKLPFVINLCAFSARGVPDRLTGPPPPFPTLPHHPPTSPLPHAHSI